MLIIKKIVPIVKPTRRTSFKNLFIFSNTLHASDGLSVHHQEFFTVHTETVYAIVFHPDPARKLLANLYDIYQCRVHSEKLLMMDGKTVRNM
jgi:hypothetical protein